MEYNSRNKLSNTIQFDVYLLKSIDHVSYFLISMYVYAKKVLINSSQITRLYDWKISSVVKNRSNNY